MPDDDDAQDQPPQDTVTCAGGIQIQAPGVTNG